MAKIKRESSEASSTSSSVSPGSWQYHGSHVGYTTEIEPMLFDISRSTGAAPWSTNYQKSDDRNAFLTFGDEGQTSPQTTSMQAVEKLVGPNGPPLLQQYQSAISRSFPIIEDACLSPAQRRNLDPALLCAIYTVSATASGFKPEKKRALDVRQLENLAMNLMDESLKKPTLSTIQAGLLLMQRSDIDNKSLNTQIINAIYELGLHLDCNTWSLSDEEKGLRKRLAWAVYMQDQWCSLTYGRPSIISKANWAVQELYDDDFGLTEESSEATLDERKRGQDAFCEMVALTEILSSILDTFYTQMAMQEYDAAGENGTRLILERAKPIQMRLKEWFTQLPKTLKLENGVTQPIIGKQSPLSSPSAPPPCPLTTQLIPSQDTSTSPTSPRKSPSTGASFAPSHAQPPPTTTSPSSAAEPPNPASSQPWTLSTASAPTTSHPSGISPARSTSLSSPPSAQCY